jgi:hypothetical protein
VVEKYGEDKLLGMVRNKYKEPDADTAAPAPDAPKVVRPPVRKTPSWPTSAFYSCISTGMHGPTAIFWANLIPSSLPSGS